MYLTPNISIHQKYNDAILINNSHITIDSFKLSERDIYGLLQNLSKVFHKNKIIIFYKDGNISYCLKDLTTEMPLGSSN